MLFLSPLYLPMKEAASAGDSTKDDLRRSGIRPPGRGTLGLPNLVFSNVDTFPNGDSRLTGAGTAGSPRTHGADCSNTWSTACSNSSTVMERMHFLSISMQVSRPHPLHSG